MINKSLLQFTVASDVYPGSKNSYKREGWKKNLSYLFCSHKFHINLSQISKNYITFYPKSCHQALKNMSLGSEIRDLEKAYSGSPIQRSERAPDPGSGSATLTVTVPNAQVEEGLNGWLELEATAGRRTERLAGLHRCMSLLKEAEVNPSHRLHRCSI